MRTLPLMLALSAAMLITAPARAQQSDPLPMPPPPATRPASQEPAPDAQASPPSEAPAETAQVPPAAVRDEGALLDGHVREGAFLAGPGSLAFILNHTLLGAGAGLAITGIPNRFSLERDSRTAMLVGTLVGAGVGFGASAWYQFNNWLDYPVAYLAITNSLIGGMFTTGLVDLFSNDALALAYSAILGAELGSWLTVALGTGELPTNKALLVGSGGAWGLAYSALLLATLATSGIRFGSTSSLVPPLLIAPGIGAGAMALASMRYNPTSTQVLRADAFGAVVGGAVLVLSGLVAGFTSPTPYVLAMISSAGAMTAVSLLWEEAAERPAARLSFGSTGQRRPYRTFWW